MADVNQKSCIAEQLEELAKLKSSELVMTFLEDFGINNLSIQLQSHELLGSSKLRIPGPGFTAEYGTLTLNPIHNGTLTLNPIHKSETCQTVKIEDIANFIREREKYINPLKTNEYDLDKEMANLEDILNGRVRSPAAKCAHVNNTSLAKERVEKIRKYLKAHGAEQI